MKGYQGNPPPASDRPLLVAVLSCPCGGVQWDVWVRGAKCIERVLGLKLVARGRVPLKANYWLMWHTAGHNLLPRWRDYRALKAHREYLIEPLMDALLELQNYEKCAVADFLPRLVRESERAKIAGDVGGKSPSEKSAVFGSQAQHPTVGGKLPIYVEFDALSGACESGQCRGDGSLSVRTRDLPSTGPTSAQLETGAKCKKGHIAPRRVRDGECMACRRIAQREYMRRRRAKDKQIEDLL